MKFKLFALALSLAALSATSVEAAKTLSPKKAKQVLLRKEKSDLSFFGASDTASTTLIGGAGFTALSFAHNQFSQGKDITPNSTGTQFMLLPGKYYVTFTGTFQGTRPPGDHGLAYNIALQLGSNPPIFVNTGSLEGGTTSFDEFYVSSISKVIRVKEPTQFSIVAKAVTSSSQITVTTRSLTIEKFE